MKSLLSSYRAALLGSTLWFSGTLSYAAITLKNPGLDLTFGANGIAESWEGQMRGGSGATFSRETAVANVERGTSSQKIVITTANDSGKYIRFYQRMLGATKGRLIEGRIYLKVSTDMFLQVMLTDGFDYYHDKIAAKTVRLNASSGDSRGWTEVVVRGYFRDTINDQGKAILEVRCFSNGTVWLDTARLTESMDSMDPSDGITKTQSLSAGPIDESYFGIGFNNKGPTSGPYAHTHFWTWPSTLDPRLVRLWDSQQMWYNLQKLRTDRFNFTPIDEMTRIGTVPCSLTLGGTLPGWASENGQRNGFPYLADWDAYVAGLVNQYKSALPGIHGRISHWEIWNEVDHSLFYYEPMAMKRLRALALRTRDILKSSDPTCKVMTPNFTDSGLASLELYLNAQGDTIADMIAIHMYYDHGPKTLGIYNTFRNLKMMMANYPNALSKPLWNTESSGGSGAGVAIVNIMSFAMGVKHVGYYQYDDAKGYGMLQDLTDPEGSLLTERGTHYRRVRQWLLGATLTNLKRHPNKVWEVQLNKGTSYRASILWRDEWNTGEGETGSFSRPAEMIWLRRLTGDGRESISGDRVTVGVSPIIIENQ